MRIQEAYLSFTNRLNKLSTNFQQNMSYWKFKELLNKATLHWVESRIKIDSVNKIRVDEVQNLVAKYKSTSTQNEEYYSIKLPEDYMHYIRSSSKGYTKACNVSLTNILAEEGNISQLLSNGLTQPSMEWEETLCTIAGNELRVYYKDFDISEIILTYYKYPVLLSTIEELPDSDFENNIVLEFGDIHTEEILDLAVQIAAGDIQDMGRYNTIQAHRQEHN